MHDGGGKGVHEIVQIYVTSFMDDPLSEIKMCIPLSLLSVLSFQDTFLCLSSYTLFSLCVYFLSSLEESSICCLSQRMPKRSPLRVRTNVSHRYGPQKMNWTFCVRNFKRNRNERWLFLGNNKTFFSLSNILTA